MWRKVTTVGVLFGCGFALASTLPHEITYTTVVPSPLLANLQAEAAPYLTTDATSIEAAPTHITVSSDSLSGYTQAEIDQRMAGLLFHVRWLIEQNKAPRRSGGGGGSGSSSRLRQQIADLQIDVDALAAATSTGGTSSGLATSSIDTSAELLAILGDETGAGNAVFSASPTFTGILSAATANFSGNVGIGTSSPSAKFTVDGSTTPSQGHALQGWGGSLYSQEYHSLKLTSPDGSGSKRYGNDFARLEVDGTGSNAIFINKASNFLATGSGVSDSNYFIDIDSTANYVAPNSSPNSTLIGIESYANNNSGYSLGRVYGSQFGAYNGAANSVTADLIAVLGSAGNGCTNCTSTNVSGVWGDIYNAGSGVVMTNAYGLRSTFFNTGTVTNTYGLYIDDVTSGTQTNQAYGVYQADTAARNYFAGNVGIGTSTPNAKLVVSNTVAATGSELITNGSLTGSAAGWTLGNCAAYGSNQVTLTNTSCSQRYVTAPSFSTVAARTYYVTFTISNVSDDLVYFYFNQNTIAPEWGPYHNGTYTIAVKTTYTGTESIFFGSWYNNAGSTWTIDDVSVKEAPAVTPSFVVNGYDGSSILTVGSTFGNLFFGQAAGSKTASYLNTFQNTFIGNFSGKENTNGNRNTFLGYNTGSANTTGYLNTFIGNGAGAANTTGASNTFIGENSGNLTSTGFNNLFAGHAAGSVNTSGYFNTFIGPYAGYYNTTGAYNTTLGFIAGGNITTGSNNIMLGYVDAPLATGSNQLNIGNLIFGTGLDGTGSTLSSGNIGIGTSTPLAKLTITNTGSGRSFLVEDQANDTSPFIITATGNVGIGTLTPNTNSSLHIEQTSSITASLSAEAGKLRIVANPGSNSASLYNGLAATAETQGGLSNNINKLTGVYGGAYHEGSGTASNVYGVWGDVYNDSTGTITNAASFHAEFGGYGGTVTNLKMLDIAILDNPGGTITNTYGVYVGDITSGTQTNTPYSFYASDPNARNYFAGNVGIGTTTPNQKLSIFANTADAAIEFSSLTGSPYKWTAGIDYSDGGKFKISSSSVLGTNDRFAIDGNGNVGIGVSPSNRGRLKVATTRTDTAGFFIGSDISITANPSGNSTAITSGLSVYSESQTGNIRDMASINGTLSGAFHNGSGVLTNLDAVYAYTDNYGQVTNVTGVSAEGYNSGVITNQKFFEVTDLANFGTVTNTYGLYIGDLTSGTQTNTPYSIYASDSGAKSYFAGNVGIGSTTPAAKFTVTGAISPTGTPLDLPYWGSLLSQEAHYAKYSGLTAGNYTNYYGNTYNVLDVGASGANTGIFNAVYQMNVTSHGANDGSYLSNIEAAIKYTAPNSSNASLIGTENNVFNSSGYGIYEMSAAYFGVENRTANSSSTIATGVTARIFNSSTGSKITDATGFRSFLQNKASNAITNWYGFNADLEVDAGTIVNTYGVYVGDVSKGTQTNTPYSFYASDPNARNYFAGNTGIGTSTPVQKLQVFGDIRLGTAGSNGCIEDYGGGVISGTCSSDERLKENIEPIAEEGRSYLEALAALTPVTYNWNERAVELYSKDGRMENLGLTAQDVEKQFPELVSVNDDGYRQVDFRALPFYIIESIKELYNRLTGLEKKVQEIDDLKRRIETLEEKNNIQYVAPEPEPQPQPGPQPDPSPSEDGEPDSNNPPAEPVVQNESLPEPEPTVVPEEAGDPTFVLVPGVSE